MSTTRFVSGTKPLNVVLICCVSFLTSGCNSDRADSSSGAEESRTKRPAAAADETDTEAGAKTGTEAGAKALLAEFLKPGADHVALTKELRPTTADFKAVFVPEFADKAEKYYAPGWDRGEASVKPKPGQTDLKLFSATTADLKAWQENAARKFPGGYQKVADKFQDGLTVYAFKFVEPGKSLGMAYDGLIFVNGKWRIFFKPWRIR